MVSPVVYVGIMVGVGTRHEAEDENGMAHYIEHCVFKGTEHYTARQLINHIEGIGGEINAYTTKEETTFYAATLCQHFRATLHLLADMVLRPAFLKKETDKEVSVILDEIESYNDSPSELIYDDFENMVFQNSTLAMPILGTKKTLRKISKSPKIALDWIAKQYTPQRMVLFVLGNLTLRQVIAAAEKEFGDFFRPNYEVSDETYFSENYQDKLRVFRRHTHQTHIMLGARSFPIGHPNQLTTYLLNNILGGSSMSSRLYLSLREKYGLVYNVDSQATPLSDTGYWNIYLACDSQHKDQCIELCHQELKKLRETRLTATQLQRALRQLHGQMAIAAENQENNALSMAKQMMYYGYAPQWKETYVKMQEISPQQLQDVANEIYDEKKIYTLMYD